MKTFESTSSLRRQEGGWGSMLSKVVGFLLLLSVFSACRSTRQQSECIHLAQRQQQQLQCHDTLWQVLNLKLDNLVIEWENDTMRERVKSVRLTASEAEIGLQQHSVTMAEVTNFCDDTLALERKETTLQSVAAPEGKRSSYWWLLPLVGVAVGLAIGFHVMRLLSRR